MRIQLSGRSSCSDSSTPGTCQGLGLKVGTFFANANETWPHGHRSRGWAARTVLARAWQQVLQQQVLAPRSVSGQLFAVSRLATATFAATATRKPRSIGKAAWRVRPRAQQPAARGRTCGVVARLVAGFVQSGGPATWRSGGGGRTTELLSSCSAAPARGRPSAAMRVIKAGSTPAIQQAGQASVDRSYPWIRH
eukprot:SAG31_NODE_4143_length_3535_cov_2.664726_2_plen_194_part_00